MQLSNSLVPRSSASSGYLLRQHGGAAAAYSLQRLDTSTGNVVRARRSTDDAESDFTAEGVSGGSLREFALNNDADIIRFANQATAADKRMYFDGSNDGVALGVNKAASGKVEFYYIHQTQNLYAGLFGRRNTANTDEIYVGFTSGTDLLTFRVNGGAVNALAAFNAGQIYKISMVWGSGSMELFIDDVSQGTASFTGGQTASTWLVAYPLPTRARGVVYDIDVYDTDQTTLLASYNGYGNTDADWEDQVGSNDGTVVGSPALFSGQGFDAYVTTLYDQSGNGRDATQATAASQPQIVADGVVVTDSNGKPACDFDATDDGLESSAGGIVFDSVVMVADADGSGTVCLVGMDSASNKYSFLYQGGTTFCNHATSISYAEAITTSQSVYATLGTDGSMRKNGTEKASGAVGTQTGNIFIGFREITGTPQAWWDGKISEIIVWPTDQASNISAIEANIAARYGIVI